MLLLLLLSEVLNPCLLFVITLLALTYTKVLTIDEAVAVRQYIWLVVHYITRALWIGIRKYSSHFYCGVICPGEGNRAKHLTKPGSKVPSRQSQVENDRSGTIAAAHCLVEVTNRVERRRTAASQHDAETYSLPLSSALFSATRPL